METIEGANGDKFPSLFAWEGSREITFTSAAGTLQREALFYGITICSRIGESGINGSFPGCSDYLR